MTREIKFRAWNKVNYRMISWEALLEIPGWEEYALIYDILNDDDLEHELMQYTGLKDKNGTNTTEIYEGDIIDSNGTVIGNCYENPTLLEDKANLLIQGFGTAAWLDTYKEAVARGCHDA